VAEATYQAAVFRHACKLGLEGDCLEAQGICLSFRPLARLAQDEECGRTGSEARSRGGLGKGVVAMSVAPESGRNRIMIYGPRNDGTYIIAGWPAASGCPKMRVVPLVDRGNSVVDASWPAAFHRQGGHNHEKRNSAWASPLARKGSALAL
jgi:hypothetical protein